MLLSVSAGAGHTRAAEALRAQAALSFPHVEVKHLDVMTLVPASFRALYADYYIKIVERHPSVWGHLIDGPKYSAATLKEITSLLVRHCALKILE